MPEPSPRDRPLRDHAVAAVWGAAEASCFFIVPDVWLSRIAMRDAPRAYRATLSALAGALLGGLATRAWARRRGRAATARALRRLPAISGAMIDRVEGEVRERGARALLLGPLRGVPYKLYVRAAAHEGVGAIELAAWSIPARLPRFAAVTALAHGLLALSRRAMPRGTADRIALPAHALAWTAFYAWYFANVGRERAGEAGGRDRAGRDPGRFDRRARARARGSSA
ncbi:hypothetical protein USB125703_00201 [Pseudoclavibacter triregionum]|nr:hypothetical protein USB125703_00201 [Pseudoclavibacter triregionum]